MGTLSENQTQEHNKEKNRPGGEDLGAAAVSKEDAHRGSECGSETRRDFGPVVWRQRCSGLRQGASRAGALSAGSFLPPSSHERSPRPQRGASRQVSLPIVNWWFSHLVLLSRLSPPPRPA